MEVLLSAQAKTDWRLLEVVVNLVETLWEYEAPEPAALTAFFNSLQVRNRLLRSLLKEYSGI
jgi:hypothetical protein